MAEKYLSLAEVLARQNSERKSLHDHDSAQYLKKQLAIITKIDQKVLKFLVTSQVNEAVQSLCFWTYLNFDFNPNEAASAQSPPMLFEGDPRHFLASYFRALAGLLLRLQNPPNQQTHALIFTEEELANIKNEFELAKKNYESSIFLADILTFPQKLQILNAEQAKINLELQEAREFLKKIKKELIDAEKAMQRAVEKSMEASEGVELADREITNKTNAYEVIDYRYRQAHESLENSKQWLAAKSFNVEKTAELKQSLESIAEKRGLAEKARRVSRKPEFMGLRARIISDSVHSMHRQQYFVNHLLLTRRKAFDLVEQAKENYARALQDYHESKELIDQAMGHRAQLCKQLQKAKAVLNALKGRKAKVRNSFQELEDYMKRYLDQLIHQIQNLRPNEHFCQYFVFSNNTICINFQKLKVDLKGLEEKIQIKIFNVLPVIHEGGNNPREQQARQSAQDGNRLPPLQSPKVAPEPPTVSAVVLNFDNEEPRLDNFCRDLCVAMAKGDALERVLELYRKDMIEGMQVSKAFPAHHVIHSASKSFLHSVRERLGDKLYIYLILALYLVSKNEQFIKFKNQLLCVHELLTEEIFQKLTRVEQALSHCSFEHVTKMMTIMAAQFQIKNNRKSPEFPSAVKTVKTINVGDLSLEGIPEKTSKPPKVNGICNGIRIPGGIGIPNGTRTPLPNPRQNLKAPTSDRSSSSSPKRK